MPFLAEAALLAVAGLVAGTLNVVAGGGSFLTLPLLLFLGLPAPVANATNRVGVMFQNVSGLWGFHRSGVMPWRWALGTALPSLAGAGLGAWLSLWVSDFAFTRLLSVAMLGVTLWTIWPRARGPNRPIGDCPCDTGTVPVSQGLSPTLVAAGFFVAGIYGGFVQAGVGFFVLAITSAAGLDLIRGNAVKLAAVLLMTALSLVIFAGAGSIDWVRGFALGAGNFIGGFLGVRVAVFKGHQWLERVVTATIIAFAVLLWTT